MSRYTEPKNRIARRFGVNVFGRTKNPMQHKAHPPGMHGAKRKKKSDFGIQLEEKQKLKAAYGMLTESQLMRYYHAAARKHKNTPEIFLQTLECRLDTVVYRLKFANTIFAAHQLVSHGHVFVNGRRVDRRSFQVQPGMVISIKEKSQKSKAINESVQGSGRSVPAYLTQDSNTFSGQLLARPSLEEISLPLEINIPMVCDFLAHSA
ncbi:MAG: 30S ribosomal protein S4 [Verrucomicrobia bacterium]|nr:30S ribosomal protein S4 [Verrucomicrobiota bacterium]